MRLFSALPLSLAMMIVPGCLLLVEPPVIVDAPGGGSGSLDDDDYSGDDDDYSGDDDDYSGDDDDDAQGDDDSVDGCYALWDCCGSIPSGWEQDACWSDYTYNENGDAGCVQIICNVADYFGYCISTACSVGCSHPNC